MKLEGIHHITCITGDAPRNLDFYTRVLGLRLVKKTVNQDDPTVYHLFYADEAGSAGADLTFFEYPGARPGRAGAGMVHRITWRLGSSEALDFWAERLAAEGVEADRDGDRLRFADPEGLGLELAVVDDAATRRSSPSTPRSRPSSRCRASTPSAPTPAIPRSRAASSRRRSPSLRGETRRGRCAASERGGLYHYDAPPPDAGVQGAGTVHHVAWATTMEEHETWREAVARGGGRPTPVIDRFWFRSVYFREPSGVLFELATLGPGFTTDEPLEHLGETLVLPPAFEHLRDRIEPALTPLPDPRAART